MSSSVKYKPKLAVFLSRFPFPLEKGDKLRAFYQIRDLSEHFEIHLFCTSDQEVSKESEGELSHFVKSLHIYKLSKARILFSLLLNFFTNKPFQVAYFTQNSIKRKITRELEEVKPDFLFCQMLRMAEYVKNYHHVPKTLDLMDALSKGMERRAQKARAPFRWIVRNEAERLRYYESKIIDYFNHVTIISEQDRTYIKHPDFKFIKVIPNGIAEHFFLEKTDSQEIDILFTGNLSYNPNIEACLFIHNEVSGLLDKNTSIAFVGANPHRMVRKCASNQIRITGWVDDIAAYYRKSRIFVAPMFSGSGMQNKILEAMASGLPCVTTQLVNNAIKAESEVEILLAETAEEFAYQIKRLREDDLLYRQISTNAKNFVRAHFDWKSVNRSLTELIENN